MKSKRLVVTGGTGFIGSSLIRRFRRDGWEVVAWVRDPKKARQQLGRGVHCVPASDEALRKAVDGAAGVVNLAGERILPARWTAKKRQRIQRSRVVTTERLIAAMTASEQRPEFLITGSAVGYYGSAPSGTCTEDTAAGSDFLARVCVAWEQAANAAEALGVRVVPIRMGLVLGREEGALATMAAPFRLGLGGVLGSGRQPVAWVHIDDLLEVVRRISEDSTLSGPVNLAVGSVSQADVVRAIGEALGMPTLLPAPALALRLVLGSAASALLEGQTVEPARLRACGYQFQFPEIGLAMQDLLGVESVSFSTVQEAPSEPYLSKRRPRRLLEQRLHLASPPEEVIPFFETPENLSVLTPPTLGFEILTPLPIDMKAGALIDYVVRLGLVPMAWRTCIEQWEPGSRFVDSQLRGPYACWWHEHRFESDGKGGTWISDRVWFRAAFGPLGRLAEWFFVERMLARIFSYRLAVIRQRFGLVLPEEP
ncbi:MAG: TIGR01777 family oxidoreductase [Myxococcota bacterium]|nr:TIGR01777 family oxidoreductase [Myxococcota bacterium]